MIKVINEVPVYEVNGNESRAVDGPKVHVLSHWSSPDRVVLQVGDTKWTVVAADLEAAVKNATNTRRF